MNEIIKKLKDPKPDYKPEPEYVDVPCEVEQVAMGEHKIVVKYDDLSWFPHELTHIPEFRGFWWIETSGQAIWVSLSWIATGLARGQTIVARFEVKHD